MILVGGLESASPLSFYKQSAASEIRKCKVQTMLIKFLAAMKFCYGCRIASFK